MSETFLKEILPVIIWVVIMIVSGRLKKNRQKGPVPKRRRQGKAPPRPVGGPSRPESPEGPKASPPTPPVMDPYRIRGETPLTQTARTPGPVPPPAVQRVVPTGLSAVLDHAFRGTAWDATIGGQIRGRGARLRDPVQLLGWVDELAEASIGQLDDVSLLVTGAVDGVVGDGEFSAATIDEFVDLSPRLVATWSRDILGDALGLALFGPGFADLRERVERQRRGRDQIPLAVAGDPGAVRMPYSVRRRVLEAGVAEYDMESGWSGVEGWGAPDDEVIFDLGGLQQIPVPAAPMATATLSIFRRLLRDRLPSIDGRDLLEVASHHPWRGSLRRHLQVAEAISRGGQVPVAEEDLLPVFLKLRAMDPDGDWEPMLLALHGLHRRTAARRERRGRQPVTGGARSRRALVEGLLLTEVLGADLGRPAARRRAGGR